MNDTQQKILELPVKIFEQAQRVNDLMNTVDEIKADIQRIESDTRFEVLQDKSLTNETLRKAAVDRVLSTHTNYQTFLRQLQVNEKILATERNVLELQHNLFKANLAVASMIPVPWSLHKAVSPA